MTKVLELYKKCQLTYQFFFIVQYLKLWDEEITNKEENPGKHDKNMMNAIRILKELRRLDPLHPDIQNNLAYRYKVFSQSPRIDDPEYYELARKRCVRRILYATPRDPLSLYNAGLLLQEDGRSHKVLKAKKYLLMAAFTGLGTNADKQGVKDTHRSRALNVAGKAYEDTNSYKLALQCFLLESKYCKERNMKPCFNNDTKARNMMRMCKTEGIDYSDINEILKDTEWITDELARLNKLIYQNSKRAKRARKESQANGVLPSNAQETPDEIGFERAVTQAWGQQNLDESVESEV